MRPPLIQLLAIALAIGVHAAIASAAEPPPTLESLLDRAHGQQLAGAYEGSIATLREALALADASDDAQAQARAEASLGAAFVWVGARGDAHHHLDRARDLAGAAGDPLLQAAVEINRGNLLASEGHVEQALAAQSAAERLALNAGNPHLAARALANAARARLDAARAAPEVRRDLDASLALLGEAQATPAPLDLRLHLGRSAARLAEVSGASADLERANRVLVAARGAAEAAGDRASESWALGFLGRLYELEGRSEEALALTRRASFLASEAGAPEAGYRWNWQTGRLLAARGELPPAIEAYRLAVTQLGRIRHELLRSYGTGISFRADVKPVYLELADLLLRTAPAPSDRTAYEIRLREVRDIVEKQKGEELRDYFRDECVDQAQARLTGLDRVSAKVAVIYPVLLPDRIEFLLTLPSGMQRVAVPGGSGDLETEVRGLRALLEKRTTREFLPHAQRLYDRLVRPWAPQLEGVDTLVFVPDGPLRTIPMSALHDGEKYLIERWAVALVPGLSLVDPKHLSENPEALLAGLSEGVQGFSPLEHVRGELESIHKSYGGDLLLDDRFRTAQVEQALEERGFTIVHLASHAQFEDEAGESFMLTYDGRLGLNGLSRAVGVARFRERPIELLALSACDTAVGTDRAALGLAGIAVKAGARSAVGTLWSVNDEAAARVMTRFYDELRDPAVSKAEALRRAQLALLGPRTSRHPFYWSAFLLINDWL